MGWEWKTAAMHRAVVYASDRTLPRARKQGRKSLSVVAARNAVLSRLSFDRIDMAIRRFPSFPAGRVTMRSSAKALCRSSESCALSIDFVTRKTTRPSSFALKRESDLERIKDAALNGWNNNFIH